MKKPTEMVQLKLRFSERLRRRLEKAAADNDDSMNSEIIRRLEKSFHEESDSLLAAIVRHTVTSEPKYVAPSHGRKLSFSTSVKSEMKRRLSAFVDSMPDAEESPLSEEEVEELWAMIERHKLTISSAKK